MPSSFPYIFPYLSLILLFKQLLLYDSQFNITIRAGWISPGNEPCTFSSLESTSISCIEPGAVSSLESTSISFIISEALPAVKVLHIDLVILESATLSSVGIDAYYWYLFTVSALSCVSEDRVDACYLFILTPLTCVGLD